MLILGYDPKILLANQFVEFLTFDLFDLLTLILNTRGPLLHVLVTKYISFLFPIVKWH